MLNRRPIFYNFRSAAECLQKRKSEILQRWESRARHELPSAFNKKHYLLIDSLPHFLDELAESIEEKSLKLTAMKDVAQSHAHQRVSLEDFSLEQVQEEYTILRQVIFEVLEESGPVNRQERNIILDFVAKSRKAASEKYMQLAQSHILWGKEQLSLALESANMGTFDWDIVNQNITWSEELKRMSGFTSEGFTSKAEDFWSWVHSDDRESLQRSIHDSLDKKQDYQSEYRVIWPDGSIHWISAQGRPYFDKSGNPIRMLGTCFEITERKKTEEQLRFANEAASNERAWFEMILNWVPTPIVLVNSDRGELLFANKATQEIHADIPKTITPEFSNNIYGLDAQGNRISRENMPRFRILRGEEVHNLELTWVTPKGTAPLFINGKLLPPAFGHPPIGILSFHDITPLKIAENELRQSEAKFRILFESDLIGVVFGDIGGGMYEVNDYFLNLIGYTREEVQQGRVSWVNLTPTEYFYLDESAISEMNLRGHCAPYEKPFIRKDGKWIWVTLTAIFIDESKFKHVAIVIDVTDRKKTRDALQESERQLRLVTESIPQIIWTAFADATIEKYNQNWYHYTGSPTDTVPGKPWQNLLHPEDVDRTLQAWKNAQTSGDYVVEHRVRRKDGVYRWFLSWARPLRDDEGTIIKWFGSSTDIDDQKRIQIALEQERELREQFVNTLSHDLKNPLTAAKTSAQIISRYPNRVDRIPNLAARITDSISRAESMIENLLDASRIRAGKGLPVEIRYCDLSDIANRVCEELTTVHGDRFRRDFQSPIKGYWSCKDLHRLLENLVTNGLKYGYSHTPITIRIKPHGSNVEIEVHNEGEPIPPEDQRRLFEPFARSKTAEVSAKKGWGLGLTLVRGVVEAHGGSVQVQSTRATGTSFLVILPRDARK